MNYSCNCDSFLRRSLPPWGLYNQCVVDLAINFFVCVLGIKFRALYMLSTHLTLIYTLSSMGFKLLFEPWIHRQASEYGERILEATHLLQRGFCILYIQSSVRIQTLSVKGLVGSHFVTWIKPPALCHRLPWMDHKWVSALCFWDGVYGPSCPWTWNYIMCL